MKNCTTHSHACDCREEYFKNLEEANNVLRDAVIYALGDISGSIVFDANTEKVMLDALAKADEIMREKK